MTLPRFLVGGVNTCNKVAIVSLLRGEVDAILVDWGVLSNMFSPCNVVILHTTEDQTHQSDLVGWVCIDVLLWEDVDCYFWLLSI